MQLHRAIVSSARLEGECVVFFETSAPSASKALEDALTILWGVPASTLEIYNCSTEWQQLNNWAFGPSSDGDLRLFETGSGMGGVLLYAEPTRTLFLVRPETLARLVIAQARIPVRKREHTRVVAGDMSVECGGRVFNVSGTSWLPGDRVTVVVDPTMPGRADFRRVGVAGPFITRKALA